MSGVTTCLQMSSLSSECLRGMWGAIGTLALLVVAQTALFLTTSHAASGRRRVVFFDIFVTGDDNRYSLSRLQVYLWTVVVAVCFVGMTVAKGEFANIPTNLGLLMGVNLAAAVAATAITTVKANASQAATQSNIVPPITPAAPLAISSTSPSLVRDIFYESGIAASLDLPRTQMFLWTLISLITYVVLFTEGFPYESARLPDVPIGMLGLMGVSQGAYLGAKAAK